MRCASRPQRAAAPQRSSSSSSQRGGERRLAEGPRSPVKDNPSAYASAGLPPNDTGKCNDLRMVSLLCSVWRKRWNSFAGRYADHALFRRLSSVGSSAAARSRDAAEDLRERWETSDSPFVHRIQVGIYQGPTLHYYPNTLCHMLTPPAGPQAPSALQYSLCWCLSTVATLACIRRTCRTRCSPRPRWRGRTGRSGCATPPSTCPPSCGRSRRTCRPSSAHTWRARSTCSRYLSHPSLQSMGIHQHLATLQASLAALSVRKLIELLGFSCSEWRSLQEHCSPEMVERLTAIIRAQQAQVSSSAARAHYLT